MWFSRAFIEWANASDTSNIDLDWAIVGARSQGQIQKVDLSLNQVASSNTQMLFRLFGPGSLS